MTRVAILRCGRLPSFVNWEIPNLEELFEDILTEGEWSFIYFNGQLSHVLLKKPAPNEYRVQSIYGGTMQVADPLTSDRRRADAVLAKLPFNILYARLDFVRVEG